MRRALTDAAHAAAYARQALAASTSAPACGRTSATTASSSMAPPPPPPAAGLDRVFVTGVPVFAHHGVLPEEAALGQRFVVDVTAHLDASPVATTDDITVGGGVSYADLHAAAVAVVGRGPRRATVEALAAGVAAAVLADHGGVAGVTVRVCKPGAPVGGLFESVGCELTRWR